MSKNDGGQAFPRAGYDGMTLRDYFAGQALIAHLISQELWFDNQKKYGDGVAVRDSTVMNVADAAYEQADAMILARGGQ